jgi:hypothetical protein
MGGRNETWVKFLSAALKVRDPLAKTMRRRDMTYDNGSQRNKFDDLNLVRLSYVTVQWTAQKKTNLFRNILLRKWHRIAWYKFTYVPDVLALFDSPRRLLQYCQLPNKNSCDISRYIWNISRYFKTLFIYFTISRCH